MATYKTTSEKILDKLAEGATFAELQENDGYSKKDLLTAALFGVAELHEEYMELAAKHGLLKDFDSYKQYMF